MSKLTSDEWITDDFGEHVFKRVPFVAELIEIAKTPGWAYLAEKFKLEQDEAISLQKAIGRLLAAAPEMYGELYEALQLLHGKSCYDGDEFSNQAESIRELLARIEGDI